MEVSTKPNEQQYSEDGSSSLDPAYLHVLQSKIAIPEPPLQDKVKQKKLKANIFNLKTFLYQHWGLKGNTTELFGCSLV